MIHVETIVETKMSNENSPKGTINQSGNFGVGVNQGEVHTEKLAGTINEGQQQNLDEAAKEIHQLLRQLEQSYPTDTTAGKMRLAASAAKKIENQPTMKKRIISALKQGGTGAFEQALNHPAASFLIGAIEGWQKGE